MQLALLRHPGTALAYFDQPPDALVTWMAGQLDIPAAAFAEYARRSQTMTDHARQLAAALGLRPPTLVRSIIRRSRWLLRRCDQLGRDLPQRNRAQLRRQAVHAGQNLIGQRLRGGVDVAAILFQASHVEKLLLEVRHWSTLRVCQCMMESRTRAHMRFMASGSFGCYFPTCGRENLPTCAL